MKKLFIILVFACLLFPFSVNAETKTITSYIVNDEEGINVRTNPTTSSSIIISLGNTTPLNFIEKSDTGNGCTKEWFKISYGGQIGYACSDYIKITTKTIEILSSEDFDKVLLTFPESYRPYLTTLHSLHPTWNFVAFNTNLNWSDVIVNENYKGRNLIWYTYGEGYRSKESYSYNYATDTYSRHTTEKNWWYASTDAIEYFMDPRNYLNDDDIFAFESLGYEETLHTKENVESILQDSFFPALYAKYSTDSYTTPFMDAANKYKVSPVHIATRILQEQGKNGTSATSGDKFTYNGNTYSSIFNFFNIHATGTNQNLNGLAWAAALYDGNSYGRPWNTPYKGILGGTQFLGEDYISDGQNTLYFEKFDVSRDGSHYYHQYQQNITAPLTEGWDTKESYEELDLIDEPIVFVIPTYNNMPQSAVLKPDNRNSNNYLKDIKINNKTLDNYLYTTLNYNYTATYDNNTIDVTATTINSKATITGTGTITLKDGINDINLVVKAENDSTKTYTIKVNKLTAPVDQPLREIMDNSGIKYNENIVHGIEPGTSVISLIESITTNNSLATVKVTDKNNVEKLEGSFCTGDKVTIKGTDIENTYDIVIYGDVNGDGVIDKLDFLGILRDYYNYSKFEGIYSVAADVNKDGAIDKLDFLGILRDYYGYAKVEQ